MKSFTFLLTSLALLAGCQSALQQAIEAPSRSPDFVSRDQYRHPRETLDFFAIQADMTVVEIWPGAGWYSEILAPLLREDGLLYAAHFSPESSVPFFRQSVATYGNKLDAHPEVYDRVILTRLQPPKELGIAPPGSADAVLTFRNVHNWAKAGTHEQVFSAFFEALKPGGTLGIVEHRAPEGWSFQQQIDSGYMTRSWIIDQAQQAGFVFVSESEVNANPADTHEHPAGVWSLPPTLRLGETDREKYLAIGESDRMTLKFIKPTDSRL